MQTTVDLGGHPIPSERAFTLCFVVGAAAALATVLFAAWVPRRRPVGEPV